MLIAENRYMKSLTFSKTLLLSLIIIVPILPCFAQNSCDKSVELFPFRKGFKMGYINKQGRIVIKPQFDNAGHFSDGLAQVEVSGKFGFINASGRLIVKPQFNMARDYSNGLAAVLVGDGTCELCGEWVYLDKTGSIVIRTGLKNGKQQANEFSEGFASFRVGSMHGFMDKSGKIVIEPKFIHVTDFHEGLAGVSGGFIDQTGKPVVDGKFSEVGIFREGLASARIGEKWGYIDKTGQVVIDMKFDDARYFSEGFAAVKIAGKYGYTDRNGRVVIEPIFDVAQEFSEGLASVLIAHKYGYIDQTGRVVIKPEFDVNGGNAFCNGLAEIVECDKPNYHCKIGYIDKLGKYIWKPGR